MQLKNLLKIPIIAAHRHPHSLLRRAQCANSTSSFSVGYLEPAFDADKPAFFGAKSAASGTRAMSSVGRCATLQADRAGTDVWRLN
jgi:hypothetical protein